MLNSSFTSSCSQAQQRPEDVNKLSIRTQQPSFQISIPFLQQSNKNIYIESFSVFDSTPNTGSTTAHGQQFLLFCDSAKGYYRFNGKQTLLCGISNWDGDSNKQIYSLLNQIPFKIQKQDNTLNFIITQADYNTETYPNEAEGNQIQNSQTRYLFNIVLNILDDDN